MKCLIVLFSICFICSLAAAQTRGLPDFLELAEKQGSAVVNIGTIHIVRGQSQMMPLPFDESDPAFGFFRRFMPHNPGGTMLQDFENKSLGSFIVSGDGYILTSAHVIDGADKAGIHYHQGLAWRQLS